MSPGVLRVDVIGTLREWERRFPVETWRVGEIDIWPYVRVKMGAKLLAAGRSRASHRPTTALRGAMESLRGALARVRDFRSTVRGVPRADVVFLGYPITRERLGTAWYERFFDPLADVLERESVRSLHLEYRLDGMAYRVPRHRPSLPIRSAVFPLTRARRGDLPEQPLRLEGYDELAETVREQFAGAETHETLRLPKLRLLRDRARAIEEIAGYFDGVFARARPRVAFCIAYYSVAHMAFCLAARRRGVQSVDVQHGVTARNPAYDGWTRFPDGGYVLLPDRFWCWSERDAGPVSGWPAAAARRHRPLVGGHPWAAFWQHAGPLADEFRKRIAAIKGSGPNLLLTLSWSSGLTEAHRQVLTASPADWTWWVRLHPSMETERREIRRWCEQHGAGRIRVDEPTDLPLPLLLQESDVHVTRNSTVIQEAAACGLPSVAIDRRAEEMYGHELESGWAVLAESTAEILAAIEAQRGAAARLPRRATYPSHGRMAEVLLDLVGK